MTNPTIFNPIFIFLNGAAAMAAWTCGLFFFRFWKKSQDRLFLIFGFSFWILALERVLSLLWADTTADNRVAIYTVRLLAFLMILAGIWDKNRARKSAQLY